MSFKHWYYSWKKINKPVDIEFGIDDWNEAKMGGLMDLDFYSGADDLFTTQDTYTVPLK